MSKRKFSDTDVCDFYKYAASEKISILQACREHGLSFNDYNIVRTWGRKLGLKCLTPAEITGHSARDSQLYLLIVHGAKTGIYVGSSTDPNLRFKQHVTKARKNGETGVNKRDRFMFEAMKNREDCFTLKVFPKKYQGSRIAPFETALIAKIKKSCPHLVLLNGLVGAPMGGYGVKLSDKEEQAIINDYRGGRITTEALAENYGVTRSTVNRILQRAAATKTRAEMRVRYDETVRQKIVEDIKAGATDNQITEKYGMSKATVFKLKKESGLTKFKVERITDVKVGDTTFPTLNAACEHYAADYKTARRRIKKLRWSVEQALEIEPRIKPYTKKLNAVTAFGVEYKSMTHASRAFGANPKLVARRVRIMGWSIEQALTTKVGDGQSCGWNPPPETQKRLDQVKKLGYRSLAEAARAYGINANAVSRRLAAGMSVKDALETPLMNSLAVRWGKPLNEIFSTYTYVIHGVTYNSYAEIGAAYGLSVSGVFGRINKNKGKPLNEIFLKGDNNE